MPQAKDRAIFHLILIKPSHYDDDGYPIQWLRTVSPSNSLACLNGLAEDCRRHKVLGEAVDIKISAFDETNQRIRPRRIIRKIQAEGGKALVALVGVQSNQFPRALDLARPFRAADIPVCIGGFHVSGCVAMLDDLHVSLQQAQALGISLYAGEAEGRLDEVLKDAYRGTLKPLYDYVRDAPNLANQPLPNLPEHHVRRTVGSYSTVDLGRGCPFQCSFCTIINVQGRKSRYRTTDDLEQIVRDNYARGINRFFITDDNFARNRNWEAFFDRMIWLREVQGFDIKFIIQVDTLCHKIPNFIPKAARAGVTRVFIGLENINPDSLSGAKKPQNRITDYRVMLQAWKQVGALTYAGYIIGFPNDRKESVLRDIEIIKRELPIDILEPFYLTPLPGSEDHKILYEKGVWMDPDLNKYDVEHRVSHHPLMSAQEADATYQEAWAAFYSPEHIETLLRRASACGMNPSTTMWLILLFFFCFRYERVHPLNGGFFRLKYRKDRRPGLPRETPLVFYARYWSHLALNHMRLAYWAIRLNRVLRAVKEDAKRQIYKDLSLMPPAERDLIELAIFNQTRGGMAAVVKKLKEDAARQAKRPASESSVSH
ncbi:MAG: radical SAM protein [Hyphomicrobiales bacterium]